MSKPIALTAALLAGTSALATMAASDAWAATAGFADLAAKVSPSVVNVSTVHHMAANEGSGMPDLPFAVPPGSPFEEFFRRHFDQHEGRSQGAPREARALGSGFIVDASGYIVTNNHVIEGADGITVTLEDGTELEATLIGTDPSTDLAVLKVDAGHPLPALPWGDSHGVRVGDWVLAVGNPFGLGGSVTAGILSARGRDIGGGPLDDYLQIDAPINQGNSGGPTFDQDGNVIGVNTAIYSPSGGSVGIGFAIPSDLAKDVVADLIDDGRVERGWFGVQIQEVSPAIAEGLGMSPARGALVASVAPDGPAASSGIVAGDVIVSFDGTPIETMRDLPRVVAKTPAGKSVAVVVLRDGDERTIDAVVAERDTSPRAASNDGGESPAATGKLGLALAPVTDEARRRFNLPDSTSGVVVVDVDPQGPAAAVGLRPGDVITMAARASVTQPSEIAEAVDEAVATKRDTVLLLVERGGDALFVAIPVGKA